MKIDLRIFDAFVDAAGELEPMRGDIAVDEFFQAGFINRNAAGLQRFDLGCVIVDANDVVADVGKACAGDKTDVTGADDGNIHRNYEEC